MTEQPHSYGAIPLNPIHRKLRRLRSKTVIAGSPVFDWSIGYDIEQIVGKLPIKDQGKSYSCSGQAGAYFLHVQERLKGKMPELSAKSIYAPIHYVGGGTTVTALETQIGAHGATLEIEVPSYEKGQLPGEGFMQDTSWENETLTDEATLRAGYLPTPVKVTCDAIAEAILIYGGVIIELAGQNNGTWDSPTPLPPSKKNKNPIWNHFLYAGKYRLHNGEKQIGCFQSWGAEVGEAGIQWLTETYITSGYVLDCCTFVKASTLNPLPSNTSVWAAVILWFKELFKEKGIAQV